MTIYEITTGVIYCYTNKNTGKRYIGQTINSEQRKRSHIHEAFERGSEYYFHRSLRKHGLDAFDYEILEENINRNDLNDRENHYITKYDTLWPNGYNQCMANSLDETAIQKMSETKKARFAKMTEEERKALMKDLCESNIGSKRNEETKKKMSESAKRYLAKNPRVRSEETKRKTSETMKRVRAEKNWSTSKKKRGAEAPL